MSVLDLHERVGVGFLHVCPDAECHCFDAIKASNWQRPGLADRIQKALDDHEAGKSVPFVSDVPASDVEPDGGDGLPAEEVWKRLEAIPGFNEELRQAEAELAAGKGIPFVDDDDGEMT